MTATIFAVSSGALPAAIAILRVSGAAAREVGERLAGPLPTPRRAAVRTLRGQDGEPLDTALVLWFPGPRTATGEDLIEFHVHGGRAVIAAVERAIVAVPGTQRAAPGDFTRRALLAGRIDHTQAEGLADLLAAETEAERRGAMLLAEGALGRDVRHWMARLSDVRAMIEAAIDYDEDGDVDVSASNGAALLAALSADVRDRLAQPTVERAREGVTVVLAGPRNAGKSALFNALIERDAAIVAPIAGTTRDRIEAPVQRGGRAFTLIDTAGLADSTDDPIEAEGIARSRAAIDAADIVVWLGDDVPEASARAIWVQSRCDVAGRAVPVAGRDLATSVFRRESISRLWEAIDARADAVLPQSASYLLHTHQQETLSQTHAAMRDAAVASDPLIRAEQLRRASVLLARLLGIDETEAMLDALFSRFCVGK